MVSTATPLHKASALGLNQDGLTPLHLASLMGNLEVLKELICLGKDLSSQGYIWETPLHCAAMMGKLEAMEELLGACPESAMSVTARDETPLHVAVIHNQFQAFKLLVEWVEKRDKLELINRKDYGGNTVLHLATSRRQYQACSMTCILSILVGDTEGINFQNC
ncbi:unnamed protein product [Ilex paraguariensis]|uniref:Uncharacterized protein n=1 Tax=Ilex paraguariensis TaxID=185542 RepID=A0ABC8QQX4_9AQUA